MIILAWYSPLFSPSRKWSGVQRSYKYEPLSVDRNKIRLLRILPRTHKNDMISCKICHVSLSENPTYVALSDNWGDQSELRTIRLNEALVDVTVSLEEALRHMKPRWELLDLWVDAFCID